MVEGTGFENRRRVSPVRGFESHLLRFLILIFTTLRIMWICNVYVSEIFSDSFHHHLIEHLEALYGQLDCGQFLWNLRTRK